MAAETFVWNELFVTGIDQVDEQHRRLIDLVNELSDTLIDGGGQDDGAMQALVGRLAEYAQYHFAEEEQLMAAAGVDGRHAEHHRAIHRKFVGQVASLWESRQTMASPAGVLLEFLIAWLSFHILGEDQSMARQVGLIRSGVAAAAAFDAEEAPHDRTTAALLGALHNLYHVLSEQNRDLAAANQLLEARVAERTRDLEKANQRLEALSRTDGLLGIANRMYFDERLRIEWRQAQRDRTPLALLMMDVDFFKRFNDTYGHQQGDACLQAVARAAKGVLFRPADLLARYGGEELVALLPNTDLAGAAVVAERIRTRLARQAIRHAASEVADHVTLSIGVAALVPDRGQPPERLVAAADEALYEAKRRGRNRIHVAAAAGAAEPVA